MKPSAPYLGLVLASCGKLSSYLTKGCRMSPYVASGTSDSDFSEDEDIALEFKSLDVKDAASVPSLKIPSNTCLPVSSSSGDLEHLRGKKGKQ
jgi:hypothetical protein